MKHRRCESFNLNTTNYAKAFTSPKKTTKKLQFMQPISPDYKQNYFDLGSESIGNLNSPPCKNLKIKI